MAKFRDKRTASSNAHKTLANSQNSPPQPISVHSMAHFRSIKVTLLEPATIGRWGKRNHFEEMKQQAKQGKKGHVGKIDGFAVFSLRLFLASLHYRAVQFLGRVLFAV